jgi:hypothetical protein
VGIFICGGYLLKMENSTNNILLEQEFTKVRSNPNIFGCYLFQDTERKFCLAAMSKIEKNKTAIKNQFREILGLGVSDSEINRKLIQYEKTHPFFLESRKDLFDFSKKISGSCETAKTSINKEIENLNNKIVVIFQKESEQNYHLINRLDTNSIALAYLLTIYRRNHSMKISDNQMVKKLDFISEAEKFYDLYFNVEPRRFNKGENSVFFEQVFKYLGDDVRMDELLKDTLEEALYVIKNTREKGMESEKEGFNYLKKKYPRNEIKDYAGDFNFVDMMGVDGVMKSKKLSQWIPVQIKSSVSKCFGNYRFCQNMCIGKNDEGDWVELYYNGDSPINSLNISSEPNIPSNVDYFGSLGVNT